jgi:hypothetical protein
MEGVLVDEPLRTHHDFEDPWGQAFDMCIGRREVPALHSPWPPTWAVQLEPEVQWAAGTDMPMASVYTLASNKRSL